MDCRERREGWAVEKASKDRRVAHRREHEQVCLSNECERLQGYEGIRCGMIQRPVIRTTIGTTVDDALYNKRRVQEMQKLRIVEDIQELRMLWRRVINDNRIIALFAGLDLHAHGAHVSTGPEYTCACRMPYSCERIEGAMSLARCI
jgi:hypothetical protein